MIQLSDVILLQIKKKKHLSSVLKAEDYVCELNNSTQWLRIKIHTLCTEKIDKKARKKTGPIEKRAQKSDKLQMLWRWKEMLEDESDV